MELQKQITELIARDIQAHPQQVSRAIDLLDEGATVPFIARYRKEVTGGLDDGQLRNLQERLIYLRQMNDRRTAVIEQIQAQGNLTDDLLQRLYQAETKQQIEDLYLPFKVKRRTRAQIAKEAGLEILANQLLEDCTLEPEKVASRYINPEKGFSDARTVLNGARDILAERFSEDAQLLQTIRQFFRLHAQMVSSLVQGREDEGMKFKDYFSYQESIQTIPSHRILAILRGQNEGVLSVKLALPAEMEEMLPHPCQQMIAKHIGIENLGRPADVWLQSVCRWTWRVKMMLAVESELLSALREQAETKAIHVFGRNLKDLLLAAPAGHKGVIGLDPGIRTGVKYAVVSETGAVLKCGAIFPHTSKNGWDESIETLETLIRQYNPTMISIGNGTASRETDRLVQELIQKNPQWTLMKVVVSEAGASVYSASELASQEFPNLDVSYRGAISIARRLQDPLAELVKIDPKAIGVGQYQHDVNQIQLARQLDAVVEDCVNAVGVDVNTASVSLLSRVSGISPSLAKAIVAYRESRGLIADRQCLLSIPRLGQKTFEQAAGFLRINQGNNPLDASGVHPEAYDVVQRIADQTGLSIQELIGNRSVISRLNPQDYVDERFGIPTIKDILLELEKPGRDPRPAFTYANFQDGINRIEDLKEGMQLEGTVTNVAAFGAFVDIGVHQDGLVHLSQLSDRFIKDPLEVVHVGQVVTVRVTQVDIARHRIGLTMKTEKESTKATKPKQVMQNAFMRAFSKMSK